MIYDCFPFFNELECLDIRLHELDKVVDRFVLVEATVTHQGTPKRLIYNDNKQYFEEFKDKIIHVIVEDMPKKIDNAFELGNFQPRQIMRGLKDCTKDDLIMSSDADEIPRASAVKQMIPGHGYGLYMKEFHYWLNCATNIGYVTTGVCPYNSGLDTLGLRQSHGGEILSNGGWHFTYMAPAERILQKLGSFTHGDYLQWPVDKLKECIEKNPPCDIQGGAYGRRMEIIPFDDSFPKYLLDNLSRFRHIIHPSVKI